MEEEKRYKVKWFDVRFINAEVNKQNFEDFDNLWVALSRACKIKKMGWAVQVTIEDTARKVSVEIT